MRTIEQRESSPATSREGAERRSLRGEELASAISHGLGFGLGVAALSILVTLAGKNGDAYRVVGLAVYGTTLVLLYLASTLYHAVRKPRAKRVLRLLDHSAIFLLIAGTYTPVTLALMRGPWGWSLFGTVWGLALLGILVKLWGPRGAGPLSTATYVAMGWLALIALRPLLRDTPAGLLGWLLLGGALYTAGVGFFLWRSMPFHHAVWHLFVLGGSICHFFGLLFHATSA